MKVSVCITTFNESGERVNKLLDALNKQTLKPHEVIVADATLNTNYQESFIKQYSKLNLQFINKAGISRSVGRNIAIKKAKNEIIVITDVGCTPHNDWLEELVKPYEIATPSARNDIVVAGGYKMVAKNNFEKAESIFLGVNQDNMDGDFMPSARSMALTKSVWKKAGGFPENLDDTAEDTVFNLNLLKAGAKFVTAKNALVDWEMPSSIHDFGLKIYAYAKGDAKSNIWWHPVKKWQTHNIKVLSIILRYLVLVISYFASQPLFWLLAICYMLYAFKKAGPWGILLQLTSDFACIIGFSHGILQTSIKRN